MTAFPQVSFTQRLATFAADIKLSHSIFALPWAILATFLAANHHQPRIGQIMLIVICMIFARTVAMAANRIFDARLDALNPRTDKRAIPSGRLSPTFVFLLTTACAVCFIGTTSLFGVFYNNWIPLAASVPVLIFVSLYPFFKRFTQFCHYYLGAALALAPICAWVAIAGNLPIDPVLMAIAVLTWTAGFDIIYACQDYQSDCETGVYSVPARCGIAPALWIARFTHLVCIGALVALLWISPTLGTGFAIAIGLTAILLIVEHSIVKPTDLSRVNMAFFTINGFISLMLGIAGLIDIAMG